MKLIALLIFSISSLHAGEYNFGYVCQTSGSWTQNALDQTEKLMATVRALQQNDSCLGIESIIGDLAVAQQMISEVGNSEEEGRDSRYEMQKSTINSALNSPDDIPSNPNKSLGSGRGDLLNLTAALHLNSAVDQLSRYKSPNLNMLIDPTPYSQLRASGQELVDLLNKAMGILPRLEQCLVNEPNQALAFISAIMGISSTIISSDSAIGSQQASGVLANLVTYMRSAKFAKVLKQLNQNELWNSMSCALESVSISYCSAKDNIKLLEWGLKSLSPERVLPKSMISSDHPIAGYYVLIRNVPTITEWLLKVQFGVDPKLATDAEFKNNVWETTTSMIKATNELLGVLNETKLTMELLGSDVAKKSELYKLVMKLSDFMNGAVKEYGSSQVNFFTTSMPSALLPLFLIGIDIEDIPPEVKPNDEGKYVMPIGQWIQNGGQYRPMFDQPDNLFQIIKKRLNGLIADALQETSKFFIRRLIVDKPNLIAEAFVHNSLSTSVVDSLMFSADYIEQLRDRTVKSPYGNHQMIPILEETYQKISEIIEVFDTYLRKEVVAKSTTEEQAQKIIEVVYKNFNVLLQRDSFLTNRMSTFVYYDYYLQLAEGVNFDRYERELLIISNTEMIQRILQVHHNEPALNREDFHNALMMNRRSLDALEDLFRNNFFQYLQALEDEGLGRPVWRRNVRVMRRVNSEVPRWMRHTPLAVFYQLGDYFFGNSYKYKLETNNPFNPKVYRGDNDHKSFLSVRNRLCVQLLAFQKPDIYREFCEGTVLDSPFYFADDKEEDLSYLNSSYNNYLVPEKTHDDRICAYRDYLRKNNVYYLTSQHKEIQRRRLQELDLKKQKKGVGIVIE